MLQINVNMVSFTEPAWDLIRENSIGKQPIYGILLLKQILNIHHEKVNVQCTEDIALDYLQTNWIPIHSLVAMPDVMCGRKLQ